MALKQADKTRSEGEAARPEAGGRALRTQLAILVPAFAVLLAVAVGLVWLNYRDARHGTVYIADAGQLRMLSQRLAKASLQSLLGNPEAFRQVQASRDAFRGILNRLTSGGEVAGESVPASPASVQPALQALGGDWKRSEASAGTLLREQKNLVGLGAAGAGERRSECKESTATTCRRTTSRQRSSPPAIS